MSASSWIISRRQDLTWFIGSALAGYLAIALMAGGFPFLPLQLVWLFIVDGPHVTSTVTRTYFDRAERRRLGWLLWVVLPLMLLGPLLVAAGQAATFFLAAFCWQQYHVVKQHVGFVMIYKAKNRERDTFDRTIDKWFLVGSLIAPLTIFVVDTQLAAWPWRRGLVMATLMIYAVVLTVWIGRQGLKLSRGADINWPKMALLAVTVPLQWLALLFAERFGASGTLQAAIPLGLFHGLQYHRLMWFHNRNRYTRPAAAEENGLAASLASSVGLYLAVALGLNFAISFLLPSLLSPISTNQIGLMIQAAIWAVPFTHYILDSRIWRVRQDRDLAVALNLA